MKRIFACVASACHGARAVRRPTLPICRAISRSRPPVYNPIYNWTGFYVGINGGGGWGNSQWDGINKFDVSGGLIGGTIGYNWQVGQIVVGAEGDIDWSGIKGSTNVLCAAGCETRNTWLATVRGRLGYAFDRFLPYVTAGLAVGDINADHAGLSRRQHHQCGLDRRRRSRIRHRRAM